MDQRTAFLIQVLERIGTPLATAVTALPVPDAGATADAALRHDAQRVAELLNRAVQLGLSVADSMNVRDAARADGVHLSLAAFASPLVAGHFMASGGRIPGDADIKRLTTALQAVLTFADNFTPAADTTLRLDNMTPGDRPADDHLVHVQMLQAFSPVLQVIGEYAFARPENKLLQDVSTRLLIRAEDLRKAMFGTGLSPRDARQADLVLLNLVCGLYATSHRMEMMRLMTMDEKTRAGTVVTMDGVWTLFDKRVEMVRLMAEQIIPAAGGVSGTTGSSDGPVPETIPTMPKIFTENKPAASGDAAPDNAAATGNPMAFFATPGKKAADSGS